MKRQEVKDLMLRIKEATNKIKEEGFNKEIDDLHKEILKKDNLTKYFILKSLRITDNNTCFNSPYAIFSNCAEDKKIFEYVIATMYVDNKSMTDTRIKAKEELRRRLNINDNDLNNVLEYEHSINDGMVGLTEYVNVVSEVFVK